MAEWEMSGDLARSQLYFSVAVLCQLVTLPQHGRLWPVGFLSSPSPTVHVGDASDSCFLNHLDSSDPHPLQLLGPLHPSLALTQRRSASEISISVSLHHRLLPSRLQTGTPMATLPEHKRSVPFPPFSLAGDFHGPL